MPTLEFNGKHHIYTHHLSVPYRPLETDKSRSCNPTSEDDNLLKELLAEDGVIFILIDDNEVHHLPTHLVVLGLVKLVFTIKFVNF